MIEQEVKISSRKATKNLKKEKAHLTEEEMRSFIDKPLKPNLEQIKGIGAGMAADFVKRASQDYSAIQNGAEIKSYLNNFFSELKKANAEFGYRSASEIFRFSAIIILARRAFT